MRKFLICLLCLLFLGCTAIKPNTMTDEELNQVVNTDCQRAAVSAAILGAFFAGIGVIPLYLVAIHECPKNNELAKKELEIRKLDSTKKEEALKREKLEAKIITKPQALEPKREQMVRNVEEKGKSAPVASAAKSTPQEKLFDKGQTVKPSPPTSTIPPQISTVPAEEVQVSLKPEKPAKVSQVAPVASVTPGTSATQSPQEKFSAPIWNIGDLWKFQQEDKKSWEAKVIRIEDKLYIIRTSKSDSFFAYDRNTLGLKFYVDKEGKRTKPENTFMTIPIDTYIYFDFPLLLGKKWAKTVSLPAKQSIGPVPTNHLEEFECIAYENVTISVGTFETIKIKLKLTYIMKGTTGVAYIWYSPELKSPIKMIFEESPFWSSERQGYELISFNLKGNQPTLPEATKLPPQKAQTPSQSLPPLPEKPQTIIPATPTPIAPQTAIKKVEILSKTPPSQPEKPQTIIPANLPPITPQTAINKVAVTGIYANIRSGAGNEFPIIATVKQGDKLILLGEYGEWYIVRLENGQEGWINNRFTK